ncbi:MAG: hypothetical protein ACOYOQ_13365 [Microthrixaceae bacterium]
MLTTTRPASSIADTPPAPTASSPDTTPVAPTFPPVEVRPGPTLHLIDLDNLVGGPGNHELVASAVPELMAQAAFVPGDHLVFAADMVLDRKAFFELPSHARLIATRGTDGADPAAGVSTALRNELECVTSSGTVRDTLRNAGVQVSGATSG